MKRNRRYLLVLLTAVSLTLITACSTQRNTSGSRWWHSFNARYNTYYNGSQAYIDGSLEKEVGNRDNFTELIPLYTVGNKNSRGLGKANFDRAIEKSEKAIHQHSIKRRPVWDKQRRKTEKDREWLSRREYNPFLWKAWMLMGRAQFHKGAFDEAASTFSYMSRLYATQPAILGKARAWLAKSYIENGWLYDAEDVIRNMSRDSMDWRAVKEWDYTYADYYLHTGEYTKAIPYLRKVIQHEMRRKQKAREWFLMGQIYAHLGQGDSAHNAFAHVIRMNPPYELEFNARIAQTEVMAEGQSKTMIGKLRRMAASDNNKEYLEQVYYAIGNIYLADRDTMQAIYAYEEGNRKATRSGIEKGVLLLRLGDLYYAKEKFADAQRCYGEAIGLLDKDREDYRQLSERSQVLDELVPYTSAVELQDSLQALAKMSEKERNTAIDRVINALKKKEKEDARILAEGEAAQTQQRNAGGTTIENYQVRQQPGTGQQGTMWYFYNPMIVAQGKETFLKLWGNRENADNWQRSNKTVVAGIGGGVDGNATVQHDSIAHELSQRDSMQSIVDSARNDPHRREYYLAQIPFTPEQTETSNKILEEGLHHSGVIFKDKMDNLRLSERNLRRVADQYPDYEQMADVYYHLFLLYNRMGLPDRAEVYVRKLKVEYPKSEWTAILSDPYFKENARLGVHLEDSLYAATYASFKFDRLNEVHANVRLSETRFPMGANRDKFLFIGGLAKLNGGDAEGCLRDMKVVLAKYPESALSEMAGMIVNGVNAGRRLRGGRFDIGDVWSRRSIVLNDSDSIAARTFSNERNANFAFMIVYKPDSVNENQLLFELARFNFTNFLVRNFEITIEEDDGLHRMQITGFRNYDEALQYARQFHRQQGIVRRLENGRTIIISEPNLEMIGNPFSYDDYDVFYAKHFAPLKVSTFRLLAEPEEVTVEKPVESTVEEIDRSLDRGVFIDNDLDVRPENTGTTVIPEIEEKRNEQSGTTVIPPNEKQRVESAGTAVIHSKPEKNVKPAGSTVVIPDEPLRKPVESLKVTTVVPDRAPVQSESKVRPTTVKPATKPVLPTKPATAKKPAIAPKKRTSTGIYFNNGFGLEPGDTTINKNKKQPVKKTGKKAKSKTFDLEDEYYDLEGF